MRKQRHWELELLTRCYTTSKWQKRDLMQPHPESAYVPTMQHGLVKMRAPRQDSPRENRKGIRKGSSILSPRERGASSAEKRPGLFHVLLRYGPRELSWAEKGIHWLSKLMSCPEGQQTLGLCLASLLSAWWLLLVWHSMPQRDTDIIAPGSSSYSL